MLSFGFGRGWWKNDGMSSSFKLKLHFIMDDVKMKDVLMQNGNRNEEKIYNVE